MLRLNKEYKINISPLLRTRYGTVDKTNPIVIYLIGKLWIVPLYDGDYEKPIEYIKSNFKRDLRKQIKQNNSKFDDKFVCDFDFNTKTMMENKKKYLCFEIFIKQNPLNIKEIKDVEMDVINIFKFVIDNFITNLKSNYFEISAKKYE